MSYSPLINQLVEALRCLPGVGPKSAQRMAFYLLDRDRDGGRHLAATLQEAIDKVGHCEQCRNLSESALCQLCASDSRDRSLLCVVETPADVHAIMQATEYKGLFFVLMGHLSPLDGIGPLDIGLDKLGQRLDSGEVREVILATNATVEGEATAHYIAEMTARREGISVSRIAQGVPMGGELEYLNSSTLSRAFLERHRIQAE